MPRQGTRRQRGSVIWLVAEVGGEPPLRLRHRPALALRVVLDLVVAEPAYHEVLRLRVGEVPTADRGAGPHRHRLRELDPRVLVHVEELPEGDLLGVLGTCRVARSGADAGVLLGDELLAAQV